MVNALLNQHNTRYVYTTHILYNTFKTCELYNKNIFIFLFTIEIVHGARSGKGTAAYMTGKFFSGSGLLDVKFKTKVKRSFVTDFFVRIHVRKGRKFSK